MNLSPLEIDQLQILLGNEPLKAIIRKVFYQVAEENRPQIDGSESNADLGEKYRAYGLSKKIIKEGFDKLDEFTKGKEKNEEQNSAL